jgi:hypothetical protein
MQEIFSDVLNLGLDSPYSLGSTGALRDGEPVSVARGDAFAFDLGSVGSERTASDRRLDPTARQRLRQEQARPILAILANPQGKLCSLEIDLKASKSIRPSAAAYSLGPGPK